MALSHKSIGLSMALWLAALGPTHPRSLWLVACGLRLASRRRRRSTQYECTTPRTCRSGAVLFLTVKDRLHRLEVGRSRFNHEHSITCNGAVVTPIRGQLILDL